MTTTTIYLIHFDRPYKHAKHYIGSTRNLEARLRAHRNGTGARLLQVIQEAGIGWSVVRTWEGGRPEERNIKNQKHSARYCPICNPKK